MQPNKTFGQLFPFHATEAIASTAVRHYGPAFLERGGPVNRARSELLKGADHATAAATAAKQGKGHIAELRLSTEHTLASAVLGRPFQSRPNPLANDPVADIEMLRRHRRVNEAQVGIGTPRYVKQKIQKSRARQVVVNTESREHLRLVGDPAYLNSTDHLRHEDTGSRPLRAQQVEEEARQVLEDVLLGSESVPEMFKVTVAATAGMKSAAASFSRSLLVAAVMRLHKGEKVDETDIAEAFRAGKDAFFKSGVQAYLLTSQFLDSAGSLFDGRLLRKLGGRVVVASAIAEVVIETAMDVLAWARGELTFEQVVRRAGVAVFASAGAVVGWTVAARLASNMGPWGSLAVTLFGAWAGAKLGQGVGEELFSPHPAPSPAPG